MSGATLAAPSRSRLWIGLSAALLMQGLWWGLLRLERAPHHQGDVLTEIRLLPLPSQRPVNEPVVRAPRPTPRAPVTATVPLIPFDDQPAPGAPVPATPSGQVADTHNTIPTAPRPAQSGLTSTLRLTLPPRAASSPRQESMLDQVRNDPRSHSESRNLEHHMADAMGSLPIQVQSSTSGTGSTVVRQGGKCTRVYDNRMKSLAPMDDRLKDAPSVAGNC